MKAERVLCQFRHWDEAVKGHGEVALADDGRPPMVVQWRGWILKRDDPFREVPVSVSGRPRRAVVYVRLTTAVCLERDEVADVEAG